MEKYSASFVGLDTSKLKISVAIAASDRGGEVRFYGDIGSDPGSVASMVATRQSGEPSCAFAMRRARRVTICIVRSLGLATTVWW